MESHISNLSEGPRMALNLVPAPFTCGGAIVVHFGRMLALRILQIPSLALFKGIAILEMDFSLKFQVTVSIRLPGILFSCAT